jgi:hypothetical protein
MELFGLLDAQNVPVAVLHYTAPTLILLYFIFASSVPAAAAPAVGEAGELANVETRARTRQEPSQTMKWIFALAVLSFVSPA